MEAQTQNKDNSNAVRIKREKMDRVARVARMKAAKEDRNVSALAVVDEALENGLSLMERNFGLK